MGNSFTSARTYSIIFKHIPLLYLYILPATITYLPSDKILDYS